MVFPYQRPNPSNGTMGHGKGRTREEEAAFKEGFFSLPSKPKKSEGKEEW